MHKKLVPIIFWNLLLLTGLFLTSCDNDEALIGLQGSLVAAAGFGTETGCERDASRSKYESFLHLRLINLGSNKRVTT